MSGFIWQRDHAAINVKIKKICELQHFQRPALRRALNRMSRLVNVIGLFSQLKKRSNFFLLTVYYFISTYLAKASAIFVYIIKTRGVVGNKNHMRFAAT